MKVIELLEGRFRGHDYELGNYPTSRDYGLWQLYNNILPNLAKSFKLPVAAFKLQSDHGFGWNSSPRAGKPYSVERVLMKVVLRRKGHDLELVTRLFPKALENWLKKSFVDVKVEVIEAKGEQEDINGNRVPPELLMRIRAEYPDEWKQRDKQKYNISW